MKTLDYSTLNVSTCWHQSWERIGEELLQIGAVCREICSNGFNMYITIRKFRILDVNQEISCLFGDHTTTFIAWFVIGWHSMWFRTTIGTLGLLWACFRFILSLFSGPRSRLLILQYPLETFLDKIYNHGFWELGGGNWHACSSWQCWKENSKTGISIFSFFGASIKVKVAEEYQEHFRNTP